MAFNVGTTSKETFSKLKNLSLQKRMDAVRGVDAATILSMLTPVQFAELFPKYYQQALPDVSGFREAISRKSRQKQDDINFGLSQGAKSLEEAEQMGSWRRRFGGDKDQETTTSSYGAAGVKGSFKAANYVALLKQAGFSDKDAVLMAAVGMQESAGNTRAANDKTSRERSYGLFQININAHDFNSPEMRYAGVRSVEDLYDPVKNAKVAYYLYYKTGTGIRHWGGYTDGNYKQYLGAAQAAAGTPAGMGPSTTGSPGAAPDFSQYVLHKGVNNYQGQCGIGTRQLAGRMFGNSYFEKGIGTGGSELAGSLSSGNKYFQSSGLYASGKPMGKDALTQEYLNSLPIGTVVSSQGGSRGGHVQIKIGPNQWASDTVQSGFFHGNSYDNFVVHEPNDTGLAILAKNGVTQPGEMPGVGPTSVKLAQDEGQSTVVAAQQTVAPVAPAPRQPDIPQEVPDNGQTATVSKPGKPTETAAKTFNVNREALIGAIKQTSEFKNTFGSSLASDEMIYSGFFDDARTKKLMADTQSSFDPNTGTVKIGNYEAFKKSVGMDTSKILTEVPSTVPSHAGGGREKVKGPLHMQHLHRHRRGDTALVTDARGKRFTVNPKKETMSVDPQTGIMDIKPKKTTEQMDIDKLMAIIRKQESGSFEGNYTSDLAAAYDARKRAGKLRKGERRNTAAGAYQFNDATWQDVLNKEVNMPAILKQYPRAASAPKDVQDQVMKARIEKWRASGYSDDEVVLHHFTGNRQGKIKASAQKGNPTPAQYRAQVASHASEYDKMKQSIPNKTIAETTDTATAQATTQPQSMASKLSEPLKSLIGSPSVEAAQVKPAPESPPKGEVSVGPAGMDENWFKQQEAASPKTRTEIQPEKPSAPIVMNPMEQRPAHMQPTPSLARAMDNARGVTNSDYTNLTGTKLGQ